MRVRIAANLIIVALCALPVVAMASNDSREALWEATVETPPHQPGGARHLRGNFTVEHDVQGSTAKIISGMAAISDLRANGYTVRIDRAHGDPTTTPGYRLPEQGADLLGALASASLRAGTATLGYSVQGRPIVAMWIGQTPESGAPAYRVLGAHHGDEWSSFEVVLSLAQFLAEHDGVDADITALLDRATVWMVPYVNPDGVVAGTRYNARDIDLNRNYEYEWNDDEFRSGNAPFSEPESRSIRTFGRWVQPVVSVSVHSGAANIGYPWNYTTESPDDAATLDDLSSLYAEITTAPDFWYTQGSLWYPTWGDTNDWSYGRSGVMDLTLEVSLDKRPPADAIEDVRQQHLAALIGLMVPPNVAGVVVDDSTGQPIPASVVLTKGGLAVGHSFRTQPGTGAFARVQIQDFDGIRISAPGYQQAEFPVGSDQPLSLAPARLDPRPVLPVQYQPDRLRLPDAWTGAVTMSQPGYRPVAGWASGGALSLPPLASGAWTITRSDGNVAARALMIPDGANPVVSATDDAIIISGGFSSSTRVWSMSGADRAPRPIPVQLDGKDLVVESSSLPESGLVDLWILSGGQNYFAPDIYGVLVDEWPAPNAEDYADGCGCDVKSGHHAWPVWSYLATLTLTVLRRRLT